MPQSDPLSPGHRRRYADAALWSFLATGFSNLLGLTGSVLVARILGAEGYGEVGVLLGTMSLFSQFASLGIAVTATKYVAQWRNTDRELTGEVITGTLVLAGGSHLVAAILLAASSTFLAGSVLNAPQLSSCLASAAFTLIVMGLDGAVLGVLSGLERFRGIARIVALRAVVNLPVTVLWVWAAGVQGIVWGMLTSAAFSVVLGGVLLLRSCREEQIPLATRIASARIWWMVRFAFPTFIAGALPVPTTWVINAILVNQPAGYQQMGLFNAAGQWRQMAIFVPAVLNTIVLSIQSNIRGSGDTNDFHRGIRDNLVGQSLLSLGVVAFLAVFAPLVMGLYGSAYSDGVELLRWSALGWFFLTPNWIFWNALLATDKVWWGLTFNLLGSALAILMALQLAHRGALGIVFAYIVSSAVQVCGQAIHYLYWRRRDGAVATNGQAA